MLIIRNEQLAVFQENSERDFILSVIKQLRANHEAALRGVAEDKIYKRVEYGIGCARKYGMTWKNNLTAYVILMFEISPDFDMYPVFQEYLTDENVPPDERMGLLLEETSEDDWQNALKASGHMLWAENMR